MNATPLQKHAVWQLIKPFWVSEERWRAWMMLIAIVVLSLGLVYISVQINQWNQVFYDALQNKNYPVFKAQLWRFTYLALIFIVLAVYKIYLTQGLQMRWRRWMTEKFMEKWLAHQAYYHTEQQQIVDNPDQRIAEDLNVLTQYTLSLSLGLLSSLVTLFSFIDILWHVSGPMTFALGQHAITLPGYMVWFALLYAVLGSLLIWWVGKPLVMLGFNQERYEANFRFGLIRIRENNDAIALYHGEPREAQQLGDRFDTIRSNWWAIMRITRRLNIATNFYGQFAIVFPLLVAAPRYFSGAIQMGGLMQIASAFGQVQGALSWFIDAFNDLATWKACVNRLAGFNAAVDQVHHQPRGIQLREETAHPLTLSNLSLHLPDGQPLLAGAEMTLQRGDRLL
ncbi:TPA: ABC transporter ATP-binding protein/permease, partial [Serratia marcescens]|nr:ABC transporter ATP-binding protein/permease [Serratia marcescens]